MVSEATECLSSTRGSFNNDLSSEWSTYLSKKLKRSSHKKKSKVKQKNYTQENILDDFAKALAERLDLKDVNTNKVCTDTIWTIYQKDLKDAQNQRRSDSKKTRTREARHC